MHVGIRLGRLRQFFSTSSATRIRADSFFRFPHDLQDAQGSLRAGAGRAYNHDNAFLARPRPLRHHGGPSPTNQGPAVARPGQTASAPATRRSPESYQQGQGTPTPSRSPEHTPASAMEGAKTMTRNNFSGSCLFAAPSRLKSQERSTASFLVPLRPLPEGDTGQRRNASNSVRRRRDPHLAHRRQSGPHLSAPGTPRTQIKQFFAEALGLGAFIPTVRGRQREYRSPAGQP